jgi:copper chaperone CopZ
MPDLHCSSCEKLVKASIGTKPGIQAVTVSLENKEVEISYNADEISSEAIIATLQEGTGYTVQEKIPETPIIETPINNYEVKNNEVQEQDLTSTNIYQIIQYSPERIVSKIIKTQGIAQVTLFAMSAGTEIYDHASTKNGIIYVLEGE